MPLSSTLLLLAIVIILPLALYSAYLWRKLFRQRKQQEEEQAELAKRHAESELEARKGIEIILRVLDQGQVSLTEAAIRIASYTQALPPTEQSAPSYQPFIALASATSHIPILEAWSELSRADKKRFDKERAELEQSHESGILEATQTLLSAHTTH